MPDGTNARKKLPSTQVLRSLFDYRPTVGLLWRHDTSFSNARKGDPVGWLDNDGYWRVKFAGRTYQLHRIVWKYHRTTEPEYIDHIDNNRSNNLIENLRESDASENMKNRQGYGRSRYKGVTPAGGRFRASFTRSGKTIHVGTFDTEVEAARAYDEAVIQAGWSSHTVLNFGDDIDELL